MGRRTPLWAAAFAAGIAVAALGLAVDRTTYIVAGVLLGLVGAGGQAFLPGETTTREREEERRARGERGAEGEAEPWPGEEHSGVASSPGPDPADSATAEADRPPTEHGAGSGTTKGKCGECGASLTLSDRRPVRATCPNCGNTRVIEE